jgi:hypothetical protein
LKDTPAPPRSYGRRLKLAEGTSPRGLTCYCTDKAGNICSSPQQICQVVLLLLRQRHGAAGSGLGTTIKFLRGAAGIGLGTAIKLLRRATSVAAGLHDHAPAANNERRRGQWPGHHDQAPAARNERRRGQRPRLRGQVPAAHSEPRRGQRPGETIKYLRRTTSAAAGNGLGTTENYLRGAAGTGLSTAANYLRGATGIGLGTANTYLRRSTSGGAGYGLGTTIKYLVNQNAGTGNNWAKAHYTKAGHEFC